MYALKNSSPATEHSSVALGLRAKLRFANACPRPWSFSLSQNKSVVFFCSRIQ